MRDKSNTPSEEPRPERSKGDGRALMITEFQEKYLAALVKGTREQARKVVDNALNEGISAKQVYLLILMPVQAALGDLWNGNKITIAEEHIATQITLSEMSRLRQILKPKPSLGLRAVVASLSGDPHGVGARVVADFLYFDGWEVDFLGENMPIEEIIRYIRQKGADLLGISVTLEEIIPSIAELAAQLKKLPKVPKLMLGGPAAIAHLEQMGTIGADAIATNAQTALETARRLLGLCPASSTLNQFLISLGMRIKVHRKKRRLSQQQLANSSGLDRAYISAIEHGKHNLTLGAVMKLSDALDLPFEELLTGDCDS